MATDNTFLYDISVLGHLGSIDHNTLIFNFKVSAPTKTNYVEQAVLTNARLRFWGRSPIFLQGQTPQFWATFSTRSLAAYYSTTGRNMENQKHKYYALTIWLYSPKFGLVGSAVTGKHLHN